MAILCKTTMPVALVVVAVVALLAVAELRPAGAITVPQLRLLVAKGNLTGVFVFGDSSVDPGNNNRLATTSKGNFLPYGKDFHHGHPTGRFSNGKLATDFIAEALGNKKAIRAFLEPGFRKTIGLPHGVSFASAGSGYDNLTSQISNVLSMSHQIDYFMHYLMHLRKKVGWKNANESIQNAVFVLSMGTNDFLQNYYIDPTRSAQYTVDQYGDYLISHLLGYVKRMHSLGARKMVVVGVVPFGCIPLVKTLKGETDCVEEYNKVARSFNLKLTKALDNMKNSLEIKTAYVDVYGLIQDAIENPKKYGFVETSKGCCGTGTMEYGITCKGLDTCDDRTKYIFWDAVHPTEKMYKIVADEALDSLVAILF